VADCLGQVADSSAGHPRRLIEPPGRPPVHDAGGRGLTFALPAGVWMVLLFPSGPSQEGSEAGSRRTRY
jgi:hypothetical protein